MLIKPPTRAPSVRQSVSYAVAHALQPKLHSGFISVSMPSKTQIQTHTTSLTLLHFFHSRTLKRHFHPSTTSSCFGSPGPSPMSAPLQAWCASRQQSSSAACKPAVRLFLKPSWDASVAAFASAAWDPSLLELFGDSVRLERSPRKNLTSKVLPWPILLSSRLPAENSCIFCTWSPSAQWVSASAAACLDVSASASKSEDWRIITHEQSAPKISQERSITTRNHWMWKGNLVWSTWTRRPKHTSKIITYNLIENSSQIFSNEDTSH